MSDVERYVPGMRGTIWYEHWHRYHFAVPFVAGKAVADAACGEGYGAALLASHAAKVTAIDISAETLALARRRYAGKPNLEFVEGRCEQLPLPPASVDVMVSFETLEHLESPAALVAEAARVLRPDGLFIVSTPDKAVYSDAAGFHNPFHPSELYEAEFRAALQAHFPAVRMYGQRVDVYSAIWPLDHEALAAHVLQASAASGGEAAPRLPPPPYLIAICGRSEAMLSPSAPALSLLGDREHEAWMRFESVADELSALRAHANRLEAALIEAQRRMAALPKR